MPIRITPASLKPATALPIALLFSGLILAHSFVHALDPEHEAQRLLIATEQAFAEGDQAQAEAHLASIRALNLELPLDYYYFNGKLLASKQQLSQARRQLEDYISSAGKDGQFYGQALSLYTEVQKQSLATQTKSTASRPGSKGKIEISWSEDHSDYLSKLLDIYDTGDPARALTRHINSLLKFYAYSDDRIIAASRMSTPSRHQLHTSQKGEIVSMNKVGAGDNIPFTENRFSVYGVNPYVSYQCSNSASSCWLMHPVTAEPWLQVVNNSEAISEMTKAISQLIKSMQQRG